MLTEIKILLHDYGQIRQMECILKAKIEIQSFQISVLIPSAHFQFTNGRETVKQQE